MRVEVNQPLLRRRERVGLAYLVGATICLVGGFILSINLADLEMQYAASLSSLLLGLLLWAKNQGYVLKWGPRWRQDEPLQRALRSLDNRYRLLVAPATNLPDYLLVGPMGVVTIVSSPVEGQVRCEQGRWNQVGRQPLALRLLTWFWPRPSLGNPSGQTLRDVAATRARLTDRLGDYASQVPVDGLVVFTHPQVTLSLEGGPPIALTLRSLRGHVRRLPKALDPDEVARVAGALHRDDSR